MLNSTYLVSRYLPTRYICIPTSIICCALSKLMSQFNSNLLQLLSNRFVEQCSPSFMFVLQLLNKFEYLLQYVMHSTYHLPIASRGVTTPPKFRGGTDKGDHCAFNDMPFKHSLHLLTDDSQLIIYSSESRQIHRLCPSHGLMDNNGALCRKNTIRKTGGYAVNYYTGSPVSSRPRINPI